jgi:hypothetical protein
MTITPAEVLLGIELLAKGSRRTALQDAMSLHIRSDLRRASTAVRRGCRIRVRYDHGWSPATRNVVDFKGYGVDLD